MQIPSLERISIQILNENEKERSKLQEFQNLYVKPRTQQKDLAGVLVAEIIQELQEEDSLQANAFGRFISSYVTKILEKGECDSETLELGFNLERWNKKNKHQAITEEKKNQQIEKIKELVWIKLEKLYHINPEELLMSNLKHFFELKNHVQFIVQNYNKDIWIYYDKCNELWKHIKQVLLSKQKLILLSDLKLVDQEAIMKQIFFNEGEVWRERGTRGMEKLEDFLKFISPKHSLCSRSPFGGIILKLDLETLPNNQTVFDYPFVGYCIGQWTNEYTYEIVTVKIF